jgi:HD-GYP domain-containing protein (c-di-GMP phosphodiesterase class II)
MRILREVVGMKGVADIVRCHHESPDGSGYPLHLESDEIPIEAAVIKVAEAYVAMTSPRPHRKKVLTQDEALEEIARDSGRSLDPTVAYFLFEMMGRPDLAARVSKGFGPPSRQLIKSRLYRPSSHPLRFMPRRGKEKRSMALGASIIMAALMAMVVFARIDASGDLGFPANPITGNTAGSLFFLAMLGLASLKPVRLPWGAYVSAASAIVLVVSLMGGPLYAVLFGFGSIGWAMLLDPSNAMSSCYSAIGGFGNGHNGYGDKNGSGRHNRKRSDRKPTFDKAVSDAAFPKHNGGITGLIRAKALHSRLSTAMAYGFVLMLAGSGSWLAYGLGTRISQALRVSESMADFIPFILGVGVFYFIESIMQSARLSSSMLSPVRLWQRNYLKIFPEPLTYAICGYALLLGSKLLGLWAVIPLFLFPTLWRHLALLRRLELLRTKESLLRAIARAVDEKDRYTGGHSASVVEIGIVIAREMGKSEPFVEQLEEAAIRHDLGKVSWPNQVLRKPARLSDEEEEEFKWTHPDVSAEIAARAGSSEQVTDMIKYHHERYDGKGYPHGLAGEDIPVGARILCVADSFDAMIHDRWYKRKRTIDGAIEEIRRCSGTQFDPEVVSAFLRVLDKMDLEKLIEAVEIEVGEIREEVAVPG